MSTTTRPASESEATALAQQPDEKAKAPAKPEYQIADIADDGSVFVKLPDGRHVAATLKDGVEVKRHAKVLVTGAGEDDDLKTVVVTGLAK